jgi:TfoX/Sxy family transcriptional regulator of competence genes
MTSRTKSSEVVETAKDAASAPACDPQILAAKVASLLPPGFAATKPMFGGVTFMHRGNMLCCASRKGLMVRVGAEAELRALQSKFASRCIGAGREMAGFVMVEPAGLTYDEEILGWLRMARDYVEPLPEKTSEAKPKKATKARAKAAR